MIEFCVDASYRKNEYTIVEGAVNKGDVHIGCRLTTAFPSVSTAPHLGTEPKNINFIVKRIVAYRRDFDTLSEGMTGQLWLIGDGAEMLGEDIFLRGDNDSPRPREETGNPYQSP